MSEILQEDEELWSALRPAFHESHADTVNQLDGKMMRSKELLEMPIESIVLLFKEVERHEILIFLAASSPVMVDAFGKGMASQHF